MSRRDHFLCIVPESVLFASVLVVIGQIQGLFFGGLDSVTMFPWLPPGTNRTLVLLWAGIWEEAAFRVCLFGGMVWLLCCCKVSRDRALVASLVVSSAVFSLCHHIGPQGYPFEFHPFLFRFEAGMLFGVLFATRGYPTAALTHSFYDLLVGCLLPLLPQATV